MQTFAEFIVASQYTLPYTWALWFFAAYPIVTSIMWITTTFFFVRRWERKDAQPSSQFPVTQAPPSVTILIPAHNEAGVISQTIGAACAIDYPAYEVVVIDDGSTDDTVDHVMPFVRSGQVRLVRKTVNEGKALALNDALPLVNGEIVLTLDADAAPEPDILWHIVPHFRSARVAAVTGNPRVRNADNFLARLQAIEFSSIVSLLRRSQRIWGRIVTVSGVVAAFRRSAVFDVGGFSPNMPTEDIELTWKLQKRFYDVRYEPRALVWMTVPTTVKGLYRQRLRWARGLMQVFHKHADVMLHWKFRRMWPVFIESALSIVWALCFVVLTLIWIASYALGIPPVGASPIPNLWGMTIGTLCLLQLLQGTLIDRRYDKGIVRYYPYAVWYPLVYWMFLSVTTVLSLSWIFRRPAAQAVRWNTQRSGSGA
ncbi:MAG: poly-beta-1,6 N-acetyl-D-glucosamine synthase [Burkholderiaceae bacterium]|nr:poly-beta-1,6 N-acetyl-D-glucosamine synthase [Burkholderiaceae bacterium]